MDKYESLTMEVIAFANEDVITASDPTVTEEV